MTREEFESAIVQAPATDGYGEVTFDFRGTPQAPCSSFSYTPVLPWDGSGEVMEECWQAYLQEFEYDWCE